MCLASRMIIRRYKPGEQAEIWELYFNTTHQVVAQHYTQDQVIRWAPSDADMEQWTQRLTRTNPFVAVENRQIVGFAELEEDGHIHYFYCHHQWLRHGVGTALLQALEAEAKMKALMFSMQRSAQRLSRFSGQEGLRQSRRQQILSAAHLPSST